MTVYISSITDLILDISGFRRHRGADPRGAGRENFKHRRCVVSSTAVAQFEITVVYNGVAKPVKANPRQAVQAVLQHALNEFGI